MAIEREPFARVPSRAGYVRIESTPKGARGFPLCRQCAAETSGPRRTFCGGACVHAWKLRTQPGYARSQVKARDGAICASCGLDTEAARLFAIRVRLRLYEMELGSFVEARTAYQRQEDARTLSYRFQLPGLPVELGRSWWQMDHVVPVAEGGGDCGLDNLRTLCTWCHARESGALRRRLNARRREAGA